MQQQRETFRESKKAGGGPAADGGEGMVTSLALQPTHLLFCTCQVVWLLNHEWHSHNGLAMPGSLQTWQERLGSSTCQISCLWHQNYAQTPFESSHNSTAGTASTEIAGWTAASGQQQAQGLPCSTQSPRDCTEAEASCGLQLKNPWGHPVNATCLQEAVGASLGEECPQLGVPQQAVLGGKGHDHDIGGYVQADIALLQ